MAAARRELSGGPEVAANDQDSESKKRIIWSSGEFVFFSIHIQSLRDFCLYSSLPSSASPSCSRCKHDLCHYCAEQHVSHTLFNLVAKTDLSSYELVVSEPFGMCLFFVAMWSTKSALTSSSRYELAKHIAALEIAITPCLVVCF